MHGIEREYCHGCPGWQPRRGHSLIELLVVVAIMVILMALLLPAVQRVREAASRMRCGNHLRQLGIALHAYHEANHRFPPAMIVGGQPTDYRHGWGQALLPYVEQNALFANYRWDVPWSDPANQAVVSARLDLFICPAAPGSRVNLESGQSYGPCDYSPIYDIDRGLVNSGLLSPWNKHREGIMGVNRGCRIEEIEDGASNTILLAEVAGRPEHWIRGRRVGETMVAGWATANLVTPINLDGFSEDGETRFGPAAINANNQDEVYSFHRFGANVVFGDGRVQFLRENISIRVMAGLVTRSGGENVLPGD